MAERVLHVRVVGDTKDLERAYGRAAKQTDTLGSKFSGMAKMAALGAGAAGLGALVVGMKSSIKAASDLSEQVNKTNVVFGKSGKEVVKWSSGLTRNFGISSRAALEASGTFGNMLVPMGFARDKAAQMSKKMVELAGDMSSFNNADPSAVLEALRSGLAGETEPLRKFGVFLSDARLKQEALTQGLYSGKGALDANAKAAATMALILKDTKDAQGDFERTNTSLANSQRVVSAQWENVSAKIGQVFIPMLATALTKLSEFIAWGERNWPKFKEAALAVFDAVRPVIDNVIDRIQAIAKVVEGVVMVIQGIRNGDWSLVWSGIKQVVVGAVEGIVATMFALPAKILGALSRKAFAGLSAIGGWIKDAVISGLEGIGRGILGMIEGAINSAINLLNSAIGAYNAIPIAPNIPKIGNVGSSAPKAPSYRGQRASGGPVDAGYSYLVGERGPEMFVPGSSGTIVPNGGGRGGGDIVIPITLEVDGQVLARMVRKYGQKEARSLVTSTVTGQGAFGLA